MRFRCREKRARGKLFGTKTSLITEGPKLDYQTWAIASFLMATSLKAISSMNAALRPRSLVEVRVVWLLAHRLHIALSPDNAPLEGPLEVDAA